MAGIGAETTKVGETESRERSALRGNRDLW